MALAVVIECSGNTYGAQVPGLPGCVAVGGSEAEVLDLIVGAIELRLAGMGEDGIPIPQPSTRVGYVDGPDDAAGRVSGG